MAEDAFAPAGGARTVVAPNTTTPLLCVSGPGASDGFLSDERGSSTRNSGRRPLLLCSCWTSLMRQLRREDIAAETFVGCGTTCSGAVCLPALAPAADVDKSVLRSRATPMLASGCTAADEL
jgi:hypothetical protein